MDTIFINSEECKASNTQKLLYDLTDKKDLKRVKKSIPLTNLSIYYTWKNIKITYNKNKFRISAPTWNDRFELPDESYYISSIQDYFEYILKKHENICWWQPTNKNIY